MRERLWCARCQYAGRDAFLFGTVAATGSEHARQELARMWERMSPHPMPDIIAVLPGALVFQEAADA